MFRKLNALLIWIIYFRFACLEPVRAADQGENLFLIEAALDRNLDVLQWLIKKGAYLNIRDDRGLTPLMYATTVYNNSEVIKTLIMSGADVNLKDEEGKTALHWAAERGTIDAIKLISSKIANTSLTDNMGRTPLHAAVSSNNEVIFSYLVKQGMNCDVKDQFGFSIVHSAALMGNTRMLEAFKDLNLNLDSVTDNGATPLLLSAFSGHNEAAKLLLEYGAHVNSLEKNNWTALHFASFTRNLELVKLLVEKNVTLDISNSEGTTPLHLAVINGDRSTARYLLENGADVFTKDNNKNTLLHGAARSGNVALLEYLASVINDLDKINNIGNTPLIEAALDGNDDAVEFLLKNGADRSILKRLGSDFVKKWISVNNTNLLKNLKKIDATFEFNEMNDQGSTLLHFASKNSSTETVKYILDSMVGELLEKLEHVHKNETYWTELEYCLPCYVNITNTVDNEGKTSLYYAAEEGNAGVIDILMNHGTDQTLPDKNGLTAFHVAAVNGRTDVLKKLAPRLIKINEVDKLGKTALFLSVENGCVDAFQYLMNLGADTQIKNIEGSSLLHAASINGHTTVLRELLKNDIILKGINATDSLNNSAMRYALKFGYTDIVELLENYGAEMKQEWLCDVVLQNDISLVKYLISKNRERIVTPCYGNGKTLFHLAVSKDDLEMLKLLSEYSRSINVADNKGKSPLWYAVEEEKWDCVTELEKVGAEIKPVMTPDEAVKNNLVSFFKYFIKKGYYFKKNLIHVASSKGFIIILKEMINSLNLENINSLDDSNKSPLWYAIQEGQWDAVDELEKAGAIIQPVLTTEDAITKNLVNFVKYFLNNGSKFASNILHVAASRGHAELVKTIIKSSNHTNINVNNVDSSSKSPLWYAIEGGHWESVDVLERAGAVLMPPITTSNAVRNNKVNFVKYLFKKGYSFSRDSLHSAAAKGYLTMIEELIKTGLNGGVNGLDIGGLSPLWYAIKEGHWECVDLLRRYGGDVTPNYSLEIAANNNYLNYVKYLIRIGISPRLNARDGIPIVYWAAIKGHTSIVEFLLESGADLEAFNPNTKNTMVIIASYYGSCETVRLLLQRGAFVNRINGSGHSALDVSEDECKYILKAYGAKSSREICHK